jgi:hypothetical protein
LWFGLLILWALGATATDEEITHAARVILVIAASASALGMVAGSFAWLAARRSYSPEARVAMSGREVALSASAILVVLGVVVALGVLLWHL